MLPVPSLGLVILASPDSRGHLESPSFFPEQAAENYDTMHAFSRVADGHRWYHVPWLPPGVAEIAERDVEYVRLLATSSAPVMVCSNSEPSPLIPRGRNEFARPCVPLGRRDDHLVVKPIIFERLLVVAYTGERYSLSPI